MNERPNYLAVFATFARNSLVREMTFRWNFLLDWAGWRFRWMRRFVQAAPLLLIRDGRIVESNLNRQMISREDLLAKLRQNGIENPVEVRKAWLEANGEISVIRTLH